MAIAAWHDADAPEISGPLEMPWPRPVLSVVRPWSDPPDDMEEMAEDDDEEPEVPPAPAPPAAASPRLAALDVRPVVRHGTDVAMRRRRRAAAQRRRRAVVGCVAVSAVAVALALPLRVLGGQAAPTARPVAVAAGSVYVVQPGDTLWSIAERLDHGGDPRALAVAIAGETGSDVVVPGERIAIP